ncbi:MAG: phospholipase [Burkholderiaceae bacterium]|nr:phospholipase [Burkholderiaceae bacterium]
MKLQRKAVWASLAATAVLAACGGGGADVVPVAPIKTVKVMGDSVSDSGTFGYKFTVQGAAPTGSASTPIWPELIASNYSNTLCPHYVFSGVAFKSTAGCTNYAVGGGRINNFTAPMSPVSIVKQLSDAAVDGFAAGDLLLIDGGGNDAADLIGAYLAASSDAGVAYRGVLSTLLPVATINAGLAGGGTGLAQLGGAYMVALADKLHDAIEVNAIRQGAMRVAVLNMPAIDKTPRLQQVLTGVTAVSGAGASAQVQVQGLLKAWLEAYNAQLDKRYAGNSKVVVVDFYTSFNDQVTQPAQFSLTNVKSTACPVTGVGTDGLPSYVFPTCTAAALSAQTPPAGATGGADWWKTYAFSDSFHPTPFAHQLLSQLVSRSLARAGWL